MYLALEILLTQNDIFQLLNSLLLEFPMKQINSLVLCFLFLPGWKEDGSGDVEHGE